MKHIIIKVIISLICVFILYCITFYGESLFPAEDSSVNFLRENDSYLDVFCFDPEEVQYDGTGEIDLLDGVSLEGYTAEELKTKVFTRIYKGDSLSEKNIQYTAETEAGKARSIRKLKLYNYTKPEIFLPKTVPNVTRNLVGNLGSLLMTQTGYAVDDGFGNDVREHTEISYEEDARNSALLHYTISYENMFGDGDVAKVDVSLIGEPAYLELTDSEVTIHKGEGFYPENYILKAFYADGKDAVGFVSYEGNINTSKVGVYEVVYELEGVKLTMHVNVIE